MRRAAILLVLLAALPSALALDPIFPGESKIQLELSDSGTLRARATHDYDDWVRTFSMDVDWSRVAVYDLARLDGVEAFGGSGEEFTEAYGTLSIHLNDQGVESSLECTLDHHATEPAWASMFVLEGTLAIQSGVGILDEEAWTCEYGGNEIVHGGPEDIPLASFPFAAAEGLADGSFPSELAVALGFAEDEADWAAEQDKEALIAELFKTGYAEAEPQLGEQSVPVARSYDVDAPTVAGFLACGDAGVDETPSSSGSCEANGVVKIEIARSSGSHVGSAPPAAAAPAGSGAPSGSASANTTAPKDADTPGAPLVLVLLGLAACALAWRRRG